MDKLRDGDLSRLSNRQNEFDRPLIQLGINSATISQTSCSNLLLKLGKLSPQYTQVLDKFFWRLRATNVTEQEKV
jgi:hypothetical protein